MEAVIAADRRKFLQGSAAAGLLIAFNLPGAKQAAAAPATDFTPNAFLSISPDNTVTVLSKHIEFGQGPYTGIATILADELDADWAQIKVESAPSDVKLVRQRRLWHPGHRRLDRHGQLVGAAAQGGR